MSKRKTPKSNITLESPQSNFTPDVGEYKSPIYCGLCKAEMPMRENRRGHTSSISAMGGREDTKRNYDAFTCPHREEMWHKQATRLIDEARQTFSAFLAEMFRKEAAAIIEKKASTKDDGSWRYGF